MAIQPAAAGCLTAATLRSAVAAANLYGARTRAGALTITAALPSLQDLGEHGHTAVAEWLADRRGARVDLEHLREPGID